MKIFCTFFTLIFLQACSNIPQPLRVEDNTALISYANVKKSPQNYIGSKVRWGGEISNISNLTDRTIIEVVNLHLSDSTAKPKSKNKSLGRFRLAYKGLLDPLIYKKGRYITALGTVSGTESGKIGKYDYLYPVINLEAIYVWEKTKTIRIKGDPFNSRFWGPYPYYGPYRSYRGYHPIR